METELATVANTVNVSETISVPLPHSKVAATVWQLSSERLWKDLHQPTALLLDTRIHKTTGTRNRDHDVDMGHNYLT